MTLNNSTVSDNTGGGIYSSAAGSVILNKSAVSGNSGHGVHNNSGTMILKDSTVSGNADGGMRNGGTLILNDSTVSGNRDGGIYNEGNLILNNSTVSGNTAGWGAGIYNRDGPVTLNNSTVSSNTARNSGGGILNDGFYDATTTLHNSILAGNSAFETGPDCAGTIGTAGHNLIGDTSGCTFSPDTGDLTNVNPDLGKLIGIPGYHPLLSGSPAIDAVPPDECTLATDQRGVARPQGPACDMGAYEYTNPGLAAGIVAAGGTPQRTPPFFAFDTPLQAAVLDSIGSPVPGATVTFSAPASGASGTFANGDTTTTTAVTDESGVATAAMFTANGLAGSYAVTAKVSGIVTPASFLLTNVGWYASGIGHDANDCQTPTTPCATIVGPLAKPGYVSGDTVLVATGIYTGAGDEVVLLDRDVTLSGGWDAAYAVQDGVSTIDGEGARRGVTVNSGVTSIIERFTMQNGSAGWPGGGGIYNDGTLTLNSSIVSGNTDDGIYNEDILTLNNGTVSGNAGDGIRNDGILAFNGSTVNDNSGRGITNNGDGRLVLNNSTVSGNTGGGIYNAGDLTLNSCTVSDNVTGSIAGGIYNDDYGGGTVSLRNSILAGNRATEAGPDCSGTIGSLGYNLVGDTSDCGFTPAPGDLLDVDPRLFVLVGSPGYHPLRPGSPAIDAGNPDGCADHLGNPFDTDQRGTPRPLDGDGDGTAICDMGAYEVDPEHPIRQLFLPIILRNYCPDFFDDFSNPASGWEVVNDSYVRSEYLNGEYRILTKRAGYFYLFRAPTCNRQNYTVKADARWVGTPGASYGLVFGITSGFEQYYLFDINTDYRKYDLVRRDPGGFTQIVWPTYSAAINGGTASNHLKVTRNGDQITLEVNGTVLGTWSDGTIGGRTWAGLVTNPYSGNPTSDARFDNFSMASLPGSGASAQEPSDVTAEEGQPTVPNARRVPASIDMGW